MYCDKDGVVFIEDDDQCITCENYAKGVSCPLIEALGQGVVSLDGDVCVSNCGFYKQFTRHLKIIK